MPENKNDIDLDDWDIHRAAEENRLDIARRLPFWGGVNVRDKHGNTPLHNAAWEDSLDVARFLIDLGADIEAQNKAGWVPLHNAAYKNSRDVARLLIEKKAVIDPMSNHHRTPLRIAAFYSFDVARLLIKHGANTDGIDLSWMNDQEDA